MKTNYGHKLILVISLIILLIGCATPSNYSSDQGINPKRTTKNQYDSDGNRLSVKKGEYGYLGHSYYHTVNDCEPREYPEWQSLNCESWQTDFEECMDRQLKNDKYACIKGPRLASAREKMALCRTTTNLSIGLTKKQVEKLFGKPTYSKMHTCGGAKGVKRWSCEVVSYLCMMNRNDPTPSSIEITFTDAFVNSWE